MEKWPVFICYRQIDGTETAERIFNLLKDQSVPLPGVAGRDLPLLDVYFDQAASAGPNWKEVHRPHLEKSKAMIVVCSPGAYTDLRADGEDDWVHTEIDWWLTNRKTAPIPVDPLGAGLKWVPRPIVNRWPDVQATRIIEKEWDALSGAELRALEARTRARLIGGILPSAKTVYQQELEDEQQRVKQLDAALVNQKSTSRRLKFSLIASLVLFFLSVAIGAVAYYQERLATALLVQTYVERGLRFIEESDDTVSMLWLTEALRLNRDPGIDYRIRQRIALPLLHIPAIQTILRHDVASNLSQSFDGHRFVQIEGTIATLIGLETGKQQRRFESTTGAIVDAALSPDGKYLSAITESFLELWHTGTGSPVFPPQKVKGDEGGRYVAFSPDSSIVVAVSEDDRRRRNQLSEDDTYERAVVQMWKTAGDGLKVNTLEPDTEVFRPVFSSDSRRLLTATWPRGWQWELPSGRDVTLPSEITRRFKSAVFSPDGLRLLTIEDDGYVRIRDPETGQVVDAKSDATTNVSGWQDKQQLREPVVDGAYSGDGRRIALLTEDGRAQVLDASNLDEVRVFDVNSKKSKANEDDVVPDRQAERLLIFRNNENAPSEMRIWNVASARPLSPRLTRPVSKLEAVIASTGETFIEIGGGLARWMKLPSRESVVKLPSDVSFEHDAEFRFDQVLFDVTLEGFKVLKLADASVKGSPLRTTQRIERVVMSEGGDRVAAIVSSSDGQIKEHAAYVWSVANFGELAILPLTRVSADTLSSYNLMFDRQGRKLFTSVHSNANLFEIDIRRTLWSRSFPFAIHKANMGEAGRYVVVDDGSAGCEMWDMRGDARLQSDRISCGYATYHETDDNLSYYVAHSGSDEEVTVVSIRDGELGVAKKIHTGRANSVVLVRPKSKKLYTAGSGVTRIWSVETGEAISDALTGDDIVTVSPDDELLFTVDEKGEGRIWETATGQLLARGLWQTDDVIGARFDTNGQHLRTFAAGGEVMTWDLGPDDRATDSLIRLAELLSQRKVTSSGSVVNLSASEMVTLWNSDTPRSE